MMSVFSNNSGFTPDMRRRCLFAWLCLLLLLVGVMAGSDACAKSAFSPRNSGMEPPGGPRSTEAIPGGSVARTPEGGMGYVDAYGNSLTDRKPEPKKMRHRPRPGAYGGPPKYEDNYLPDPAKSGGSPLWNFR